VQNNERSDKSMIYKSSEEFIVSNYSELQRIFNCIGIGIFITNGEGKILLVNDESLKTGGYTRDRLVGRYMKDLITNGYVEDSAALKTIESGRAEHIIQSLPDGERIYIKGVPLIRNNKIDLAYEFARKTQGAVILQKQST